MLESVDAPFDTQPLLITDRIASLTSKQGELSQKVFRQPLAIGTFCVELGLHAELVALPQQLVALGEGVVGQRHEEVLDLR